jgi:hypothetical protein
MGFSGMVFIELLGFVKIYQFRTFYGAHRRKRAGTHKSVLSCKIQK